MTGPAWVTGTITVAPAEDCTGPTSNTTVDGVGHELGHRCEAEPFAASDPRLSGTGVEQRNQDAHQAPGNPTMVIGAGTYDLQNANGDWHCSFDASFTHNVDGSYQVSTTETSGCVGAGAYEGLSAILAIDWGGAIGMTVPFTGVIFPGELPPSP